MIGADGTGGGAADPDQAGDTARAVGWFVAAAVDLPVDRLDDIEDLAAAAIGARRACVFVADYALEVLAPLAPVGGAADPTAAAIDTTIHGRVFQTGETHVGAGRVVTPLAEGRERVGVVEYVFADDDVPAATVAAADAVGRALMLVLVSKRRYTDLLLRARRARPLTTAAEMQWDLLPPLACTASGASISGILEPAYATGGDSFDYALNGDLLEFIVIDAVGHAMPAVLKSMAAITTYRNVRREGGSLDDVYAAIDQVMVEQFGRSYYVTGVIGSLRMSTAELTWINAGHPEPLLVRDGSAMPELHCRPSTPMGLGGTVRERQTTVLQPGDRLLVYTDGVVERRPEQSTAHHLVPLTDLLVRSTLDGLPGPETVRRLARSVLDSCDGELRDDATLVLIDVHRTGG